MKLIIHFKGGLGNQLIQYSFAHAVMKEGDQLINDTSHYSLYKKRIFFLKALSHLQVNVFLKGYLLVNMYLRIIAKRLYKKGWIPKPELLLRNYIDDETAMQALSIKHRFKYIFIDGYFQEVPLFPDKRKYSLVKHLNTLLPAEDSLDNYQLIKAVKNPVMLHLRCGDYYSNTTVQEIMGVCSFEYYKKGLLTVTENLKEYSLFIFSDDVEFAKRFFGDFSNARFIKGDIKNPISDFLLMRQFSYAVIPNSTLSYMACMLSTFDDNKVVLPSPWFNNSQQFLLGSKKGWVYVAK
ncbi:MAG: putative glycosyl transferase [Flavisolibacter sp.]|nr:putative glycosyl transferase [Flavisolibacter sp.]